MKKYCLLSLKWSKGKERYVWWRGDESGYTEDINQAGIYEVDGEVPLRWMNKSVVAIPHEIVSNLQTNIIAPTTIENWKTLNINLDELPHY